MTDSGCHCRDDVDQLREDVYRTLNDRFAGSDKIWHEKIADFGKLMAQKEGADERALKLAADSIKIHFETVNNFQRRIERMEETFVTTRDVLSYLSIAGAIVLGVVAILSFVWPLVRH